MIRRAYKLYCDNEHGTADGSVVFPERGDYINGISARELRRRAKAAGWACTRTNDFCPDCAINEMDISEDAKEDLRIAREQAPR